MVAERGPFTPTSNLYTAALTPSVAIKQGDLIGVTKLTACGNAGQIVGFPSEGFLEYAGDVTGSVDIAAAAAHPGGVLSVIATGTASEWMARIIPNVGSTPGGFGSDVVAAMGQTGKGSLDISVPAGPNPPMLLARVYNDGGAAGTSSFTEEAIAYSDAVETESHVLARGVTAFLVAPRDPARSRFHIGVRTLYSGATIQLTVRDATGTVVRTLSHTYTANYYIQTDAATFAGGPVAGDQTIQITVTSGSIIVYGTSTDNTTNDPSIQFAYGVFAIA